jgi:hypothetical protein
MSNSSFNLYSAAYQKSGKVQPRPNIFKVLLASQMRHLRQLLNEVVECEDAEEYFNGKEKVGVPIRQVTNEANSSKAVRSCHTA